MNRFLHRCAHPSRRGALGLAAPKLVSAALLLTFVAAAAPVRAEILYGITAGSNLVSFDSANPASLTTVGPLTGVLAGHTVHAIDFDPLSGKLYALSVAPAQSTGQLYIVELATAALTALPLAASSPAFSSPFGFSIDFDPIAREIRVVSTSDANLALSATQGNVLRTGTDIRPSSVIITDIAYSNPMNAGPIQQTILYCYNAPTQSLGTISGDSGIFSPYSLFSSGASLTSTATGFDISSASGIGYISGPANGIGDDNPELFTADLTTGALAFVGSFPTNVIDIAVAPAAAFAPEPGTIALLTLGTIAASVVTRRRKTG